MKTSPSLPSFRLAGFLTCAAFLLTGFSVRSSAHAASPEASQPSTATKEATPSTKATVPGSTTTVRDAVSDAWEKSKDAPFKQCEAVRERMKSAESLLDAKILEWTAKKDAVAEDSKQAVNAAHKEVREAREVLSQKINALDNATEETWSSVKAELNTAWQRMTTAASDLAARLQS